MGEGAPPSHIKFSLSKSPLVVTLPLSRFPPREGRGEYVCCLPRIRCHRHLDTRAGPFQQSQQSGVRVTEDAGNPSNPALPPSGSLVPCKSLRAPGLRAQEGELRGATVTTPE